MVDKEGYGHACNDDYKVGSSHSCNCGCSSVNFIQTDFVAEGWRCPVCKRILSPWTTMCPCNGQGIKTEWTSTTSSSSGETSTITLHNNDIKTPDVNVYYNSGEIKKEEN